VRLTVVVKLGEHPVAEVVGRDVPDDVISLYDVNQIIETESFLERLTGLRWHIYAGNADGDPRLAEACPSCGAPAGEWCYWPESAHVVGNLCTTRGQT
jgi:hypothetical protein